MTLRLGHDGNEWGRFKRATHLVKAYFNEWRYMAQKHERWRYVCLIACKFHVETVIVNLLRRTFIGWKQRVAINQAKDQACKQSVTNYQARDQTSSDLLRLVLQNWSEAVYKVCLFMYVYIYVCIEDYNV
mmetsp:Transcript_1417/g.1930  ORF Transcript_1417/g.1930 Transcript_1417/m.1930 type:complete len:130 (-) Transcript_1417:653-1042(-)